ncbi:MAG: hypothetical protein JXN61_17820, partial [Sedimentisphaerales bacterium]|nr:hypothetical protein [Sedimentisphaerales bacterium]
KAMGMLDTMVHGENAFLAGVAQEIKLREATVGYESGYQDGHRVVFKKMRTVDYRASIHDIANYLMDLMQDAQMRDKMGQAGRKRAVEVFDYRVVAKRFVQIISDRLGIS